MKELSPCICFGRNCEEVGGFSHCHDVMFWLEGKKLQGHSFPVSSQEESWRLSICSLHSRTTWRLNSSKICTSKCLALLNSPQRVVIRARRRSPRRRNDWKYHLQQALTPFCLLRLAPEKVQLVNGAWRRIDYTRESKRPTLVVRLEVLPSIELLEYAGQNLYWSNQCTTNCESHPIFTWLTFHCLGSVGDERQRSASCWRRWEGCSGCAFTKRNHSEGSWRLGPLLDVGLPCKLTYNIDIW